jgi:hypothetical protein
MQDPNPNQGTHSANPQSYHLKSELRNASFFPSSSPFSSLLFLQKRRGYEIRYDTR